MQKSGVGRASYTSLCVQDDVYDAFDWREINHDMSHTLIHTARACFFEATRMVENEPNQQLLDAEKEDF